MTNNILKVMKLSKYLSNSKMRNNEKATFQATQKMQFFAVKIMEMLKNTASSNSFSVLNVVQLQVLSKI